MGLLNSDLNKSGIKLEQSENINRMQYYMVNRMQYYMVGECTCGWA